MLANPLRSDAPEGSPISGDAAVPTAQIFCTTTEVAQKQKFCEDQDSALGPPTKISRGTLLVFQASSIGIQQIPHVPLVTSSLKRKNSEDHDLALGPPAKVPRTTSLISPRGHTCLIWRLPNELLGHITSFLPLNSLLALTQVLNSLISLSLSSTKLPYSAIFFFYLDDMNGGRLPGFKMSRQFRFHPYARVKPSAREIVALYDDTYDEDHTIPSSSTTSDSGTASVSGRLSSYKLLRQYRYHPYTRMKPSAREIVTAVVYTA
ncbi:hypothetical protein F5141DRAFT_1222473 [Pisolithus sp. B1]|nr:hypothetical protein F5141DRAFT_1222473 [Pisolithus sp. B1]